MSSEFEVDNIIYSGSEVRNLDFSNEELYDLRMILKEHLLDIDEQIEDAIDNDKSELESYKIRVENLLKKLNK